LLTDKSRYKPSRRNTQTLLLEKLPLALLWAACVDSQGCIMKPLSSMQLKVLPIVAIHSERSRLKVPRHYQEVSQSQKVSSGFYSLASSQTKAKSRNSRKNYSNAVNYHQNKRNSSEHSPKICMQ